MTVTFDTFTDEVLKTSKIWLPGVNNTDEAIRIIKSRYINPCNFSFYQLTTKWSWKHY